MDTTQKREAFRALHQNGCFVMPNPWDRGSAAFLAELGFPALATSSAAFAFSRALPDVVTAIPRDLMLAHVAEMVAATDLPVSADLQSGYADDSSGVSDSVRRCLATGVAGLSIEDATGDARKPLYDLEEAVERIRAARGAIEGSGAVLTARAECFLVGHPDPLEESIRRLQAYAEAGADALFAPGLKDRDGIRRIVAAVAPKPVNVLVGWKSELSVSDLAALGVRRISVGSALARAAWTAFVKAARAIASSGDFSGLDGILSTRELSAWFSAAPRESR